MISKRIYVTPKDIREGGVWDGNGKDAISKAMTRALKTRVCVGATLFACNNRNQSLMIGRLPEKLTALHDKLGRTNPINGPRFNFRIQLPD